jgi:NTP pyrophosphatase (non-canonical NTP hydrolase)
MPDAEEMTDEEKLDECYRAHKQFWGPRHHARVVDQLIEEMAELTKELMKQRRGGEIPRIREELADVLIGLLFLGEDEDYGASEWFNDRLVEIAENLTRQLKHWMDVPVNERPPQFR